MATQKLLGQVVVTGYNNRTYRVDDVAWDLSPLSTFEKKEGEKISYMEYYAKSHGINIKNSEQPLLSHKVRRKGADDEIIYLIPELCNMTGM
jgi:aubergine